MSKTTCPTSRVSRLRCQVEGAEHGYRTQYTTVDGILRSEGAPRVGHEVRKGRMVRVRYYGRGFAPCAAPASVKGRYVVGIAPIRGAVARGRDWELVELAGPSQWRTARCGATSIVPSGVAGTARVPVEAPLAGMPYQGYGCDVSPREHYPSQNRCSTVLPTYPYPTRRP